MSSVVLSWPDAVAPALPAEGAGLGGAVPTAAAELDGLAEAAPALAAGATVLADAPSDGEALPAEATLGLAAALAPLAGAEAGPGEDAGATAPPQAARTAGAAITKLVRN
jgi:hypothetical protein